MDLQFSDCCQIMGTSECFFLLTIEKHIPSRFPPRRVLSFGGFLTELTSLTIQGMLLASTAGSLAGAVILYGAGA